MAVHRFLRRETWLVVGALSAIAGASVLFSVAWLQACGIVRVFHVVQTHPDGGVDAVRRLGLSAPSVALTTAYSNARFVVVVGFLIWVLRLALDAAGYRIGGWRAIGLAIPPVLIGVLAGALHQTIDAGAAGRPCRWRVGTGRCSVARLLPRRVSSGSCWRPG